MKTFKEFEKIYNDVITAASGTTKDIAYIAYMRGYAEGMENLSNLLSAPLTLPQTPNPIMPPYIATCDTQAQLLHEEAEKMQVYPEQLEKEYSPEELKEIQKAVKDMNGYLTGQKGKQNAETEEN